MPDIAKLTHEAELGQGSALRADFLGHSIEDNLKLMQQISKENKKHIVDDPNTPELLFEVEGSGTGVTGKLFLLGPHWWNRATELVHDSLTINGPNNNSVAVQDLQFFDSSSKK